jgi:hypothetical protein
MRRRLTAAALAVLASLVVAGPSFADNYVVNGTADPAVLPPCEGSSPNFTCSTLRAAVNEANDAANADIIVLVVPGDFVLSTGPLTLTSNVTIGGAGPNTSTIVANGNTRAITVTSGGQASLTGMTIRGGVFTTGDGNGGNILVEPGGEVYLTLTRVTGGTANRGAGISNSGTLTINSSLIDTNTAHFVGGGIHNDGSSGAPAELNVINSTIAANIAPDGGAISSLGNSANAVRLTHATIGRNSPGGSGIWFDGAQTTVANASIFANNGNANCAGATFASATGSLESGTACGFSGPGNRQNADPGLSAALVNAGGEVQTMVLTIPADSPAVDLVNPCQFPIDQRYAPRYTEVGAPCDAGAYEQSASGNGSPQPQPTATPTATAAQTPVPTPTPTPTATPVAGKSVDAKPVSGTVTVKLPGSNKFVPLNPSVIPNGAEVDTRKGKVEITRSDGGKAKFSEGFFKISQTASLTTLTLTEELDCKKKAKVSASAAAKKPKSRRLWGEGRGKFRTKGQYGAATVRGTKWLVRDTCTTTFIKVTEGAVTVRDLVKNKNVVLRKGKSYTARARK